MVLVNCEIKMATRRSQRMRSQSKRLMDEVDSQSVAIEKERRKSLKVESICLALKNETTVGMKLLLLQMALLESTE